MDCFFPGQNYLSQDSGAGGGDRGILLSDIPACGARCLAVWSAAVISVLFGLPFPE